jgi:hypothetical protein
MTVKQLERLSNVIIKIISPIPNPHEKVPTNEKEELPSWVGSGYSKLHIWTLTEFE